MPNPRLQAKVDKMAGRQISFTKPKKKGKKLQKGVRRSPRHKKSAPGQSSLSRSTGVARGLVVAETPAKELEKKAQMKQKGMNVARTSNRHFVGILDIGVMCWPFRLCYYMLLIDYY